MTKGKWEAYGPRGDMRLVTLRVHSSTPRFAPFPGLRLKTGDWR